MTNNKDLFQEPSNISTLKVRVGDDKFITMNEKETIVISTNRDTNLIYDMLYVPEVDQKLLSVGQLGEKYYKMLFKKKFI